MEEFKIKAFNQQEFDAAGTDGSVYGEIYVYVEGRMRKLYACADLGVGVKCSPKLRNDLNTEFKCFVKCDVFISQTREELRAEIYVDQSYNVAVTVYF